MNGQIANLFEYQKAAQQYISSLPASGGQWLTEQREAAVSRFVDLGFPHAKQEAWRYTSVKGLLQENFVSTDEIGEVPRHAVTENFMPEPVAARLVFVDGLFQPDLSNCELADVQVGSLRGAMETADKSTLQAVGSLSGAGEHGFSALNMATMQDGAVVRVSAGTQLELPIELLNIATKASAGRSLRPRHLILLEDKAKATLIERYLALDETCYFNNLVCEVVLREGANLRHQRIQQESLKAYHLSELYIGLAADAHYQGVNTAIGGAWARSTINNRFSAPGANCELDGLYLAGDGQLVDFHLDIDHAVPGCASRENFKGILHGCGRAVFDGLIQVREQAQKTDAHLHNANLMLSRHAEVDTKPQLQIFADDVQCSHGTSVGQLDAQALFYMRSRGLSEDQAKRLLCVGFANEVLERFDSASLREQLGELLRQRIQNDVSQENVGADRKQ